MQESRLPLTPLLPYSLTALLLTTYYLLLLTTYYLLPTTYYLVQESRAQLATQLTHLRSAEKGWIAERKALLRQVQTRGSSGPAASLPLTAGTASCSAALSTSAARALGAPMASVSSRRVRTKDVKTAAAEELEDALAAARMQQHT